VCDSIEFPPVAVCGRQMSSQLGVATR